MTVNRNILIAVDDSGATDRAIAYVASLIGRQKGFHIRLIHIAPVPPGLLEFRGKEDPRAERGGEAEIIEAQARWVKQSVEPLFAKAKSILRKAGVPAKAVETQFATSIDGQDVVTSILEAARTNACGTVVVGRGSFSWLRELVQSHVGDELIRRGYGLTIWVVE